MASDAPTDRVIAARIVHDVAHDGRSLDDALASVQGSPFITQLAYNTLRFYIALDRSVRPRLQRPPRGRQRLLHALLLCGAFELAAATRPAYAVVNETVAAAVPLGFGRGKGFLNATLRGLQRDGLTLDALRGPSSHPDWLMALMTDDWGEAQARQIALENDIQGPMTLRVNLQRQRLVDHLDALTALGASGRAGAAAPTAIELDRPLAVDALPGFAEGMVSVQDESAQLAVELLRATLPRPDGRALRLLDACAAPGGKTGHLLEAFPDCELTAIDSDPDRMRRVENTLVRLNGRARTMAVDARNVDWSATAPEPFDAILLDAPCSGTGVIRRHPDIKLLRRRTDLDAFARIQGELLAALWPRLRPGGYLLYCTCSILRRENDAVVAAFLANTADCADATPTVDWAHATTHGLQRFPGDGRAEAPGTPAHDSGGGDGFYYALLEKRPA